MVAGAAFLGRLGPNRAKNPAPSPRERFFGCPAGAAFLGRLGPNRAKNTAPVNFLAAERGFLGVQREPHFSAVWGLIGPKIRLPSISWPQREVFWVSSGSRIFGPFRA